MTEARPRRTRWSKGRLRALAWATGGATVVLAAAPLVAAPRPPVDGSQGATRAPARRIIERHITRRIIIVDPVVTAPTTTSGGVSVQAPAPAPAPPATSTGGS
jgi:hypothetical protein